MFLLLSPKGSLVGRIRVFNMRKLFHGWGTFGGSLFPLRVFFIFRSLRLDSHRYCYLSYRYTDSYVITCLCFLRGT